MGYRNLERWARKRLEEVQELDVPQSMRDAFAPYHGECGGVMEGSGEAANADSKLGLTEDFMINREYAVEGKGPVGFVEEVLGLGNCPCGCKVENYQRRVLNASVCNDRVAWRAGHGVGKTTTMSWILLWFLLTRPFARILVVAPAFKRQVGKYFFPEVKKWVYHAERYGKFDDLPVNVRPEQIDVKGYKDEWMALAIQASEPEKVEGGHATSLCVLADEAKGLSAEVVQALHGTQTDVGGDRLYFMASTPGGPSGAFYETFRQGHKLWSLHHVSALESDRVSNEWVKERQEEWGEHSPVYIARVLGEFPEEAEGQLFRLSDLEEACLPNRVERVEKQQAKRAEENGETPEVILSLDVAAAEAGDRNVLCKWEGQILRDMKIMNGMEPMDVAAWASSWYNRWDADQINVDIIGIGRGVGDRLRQLGKRVRAVDFRGACDDPVQFVNRRAELYWRAREACESGDIAFDLDHDKNKRNDLVAELSSILYEHTARGKIKIERKKDTKKRVGHSPDLADSAVIGYPSRAAAGVFLQIGGRRVQA